MTVGVSIPIRSLLVTGKQQLKQHSCLWAIVGSCVVAGTFTTSALLYASTKEGVIWNRWRASRPYDSVKWDKPQQKMIILPQAAKSLYKEDRPLQNLLKEIYNDGRYDVTMRKEGQ